MYRSFFVSAFVAALVIASQQCSHATAGHVPAQEFEDYDIGQHIEVKVKSEWMTGFVREKLRGPAYKVNFYNVKSGAKNTDFFFPPEMRKSNGRGFEPTSPETRTWISTQGTKAIASLIYSDGENVILRRNRKTVVVAIDKLSDADQTYLNELRTGKRKSTRKTTKDPTSLKDLIGMDKDELLEKMKRDQERMTREIERLQNGGAADVNDPYAEDPIDENLGTEDEGSDEKNSTSEQLDTGFDEPDPVDPSSIFDAHLENFPDDMQKEIKQHMEEFKKQMQDHDKELESRRTARNPNRRSNPRTRPGNNSFTAPSPRDARPSTDKRQIPPLGEKQIAEPPVSFQPQSRELTHQQQGKRIGMGVAYLGIFLMVSIGFVFMVVKIVTVITRKNDF